jgi:hypothetical protein
LGFWRMMGFGLTEPDHGSNPGGMWITNFKDIRTTIIKAKWLVNSFCNVVLKWKKTTLTYIVERRCKDFPHQNSQQMISLKEHSFTESFILITKPKKRKLSCQTNQTEVPLGCLDSARFRCFVMLLVALWADTAFYAAVKNGLIWNRLTVSLQQKKLAKWLQNHQHS